MNLFEQQANEFAGRHIGPDEKETSGMLASIGVRSLDELIDRTIPASIRSRKSPQHPRPAKRIPIPDLPSRNRR